MCLRPDPENPLPLYVLGGVPVQDFLDNHLQHVQDPLVADLGSLQLSSSYNNASSSSNNNTSSLISAAWSVRDPHSSFYDAIMDNIFAPAGPALASDVLQKVPRMVDFQMCNRSMQTNGPDSDSPDGVSTEYITVSKV